MKTGTLILEQQCNASCHFCALRLPWLQAPNDATEVLKKLDEFKENGVTDITITGGEPTLDKNLLQTLRRCGELGMTTTLETNGWLLESAESLKQLNSAGLNKIKLFLPTLSPKTLILLMVNLKAADLTARALAILDEAKNEFDISMPIGFWNGTNLGSELLHLLSRYSSVGMVELSILEPSLTPTSFRHKLLPYNAITNYIKNAFVKLPDDMRSQISLRKGQTIPLCVSDARGLPKSFFKSHQRPVEDGPSKTIYGEQCQRCAAKQLCRGIPQDYLDHFGEQEFSAFSADYFEEQIAPLILDSSREGHDKAFLNSVIADRDHWSSFRRKTVVIRLNGKCNIRCTHCWVDFDRPDESLSSTKRMIDDAVEENVYEIALSGGEPTLYPHLDEVVSYCKELGIMSVELQTNAIKLSKPGYAEHLRRLGITKAFTTLLSSNDTTAERVAGTKKAFSATVAGIKAMCDAGIATTINYVINKENLSDLVSFVNFYNEELFSQYRNIHLNFGCAQPINVLSVQTRSFQKKNEGQLLDEGKSYDQYLSQTSIPDFDEVRGPLREAVEYLWKHKIPFHGLNSLSGVPLCVLDSDERFFPKEHRWRGTRMDKIFDKPQPCQECSVRDECIGVRRGYMALYGTKGIRPISS